MIHHVKPVLTSILKNNTDLIRHRILNSSLKGICLTHAAQQMLLSESHQKVESLETNWKWKYTQTHTHTQRSGSREDVKESEFYEVSGFRTITMLTFLTFLPSYHGNSFFLIVLCRCIWKPSDAGCDRIPSVICRYISWYILNILLWGGERLMKMKC